MKGLAHGEGDLKYASGTRVKAYGYYDSRLGKFLPKSNSPTVIQKSNDGIVHIQSVKDHTEQFGKCTQHYP